MRGTAAAVIGTLALLCFVVVWFYIGLQMWLWVWWAGLLWTGLTGLGIASVLE